MIDGDGNARILDFGLAGLAGEFLDDEATAGTPAYMAPEQLEGKSATVRSDIYSLGLVLYELFTGKRAFEAGTLRELIKLRRSDTSPTTPTSIVKDLDPLIERVIDRCLQKDESQRPASALQVAAALPGGDPIAAALAAGETPSPEMVAAAPKEGALRPPVALACLAAVVVSLGFLIAFAGRAKLDQNVPLEKPPEVLAERARDIVKGAGYSNRPVDEAYGFDASFSQYAQALAKSDFNWELVKTGQPLTFYLWFRQSPRYLGYTEQPLDSADGVILKIDYINYIAAHDQTATRWEKMRNLGPGPYRFWYRQSPRYFETLEGIQVDKPALDVSGMASVYLDMEGRLHWFIGVPPQREPQGIQNPTPDWSIPFHEAGLELTNFQPVTSTWVPLHAYDVRAAWDGVDPAQPENKIHVEAAAFRGKPVYFETIYPWDEPLRQDQPPESGADRVLTFIIMGVVLLALVGSVVLARMNLRLGRGDRRGATRVALLYLTVRMLVWLFVEHHNGLPERELNLFLLYLAGAVFSSGFLWLLYVGLEPFVRKRWPGWIISWSRLLAGEYRDPLVGRDILIGAVIGAGMILIGILVTVGPRLIGRPPSLAINPGNFSVGSHFFFGRFATQLSAAFFLSFIFVFLLLLFVAVLRRERLALVALWLLLTLVNTLITQASLSMIPLSALSAFLVVFALKRYGLLAASSALFFFHLWVFYPMTTELTAWYAVDFTIALVVCLTLAVYGFYTSLGGQPLFGGRLLQDE